MDLASLRAFVCSQIAETVPFGLCFTVQTGIAFSALVCYSYYDYLCVA